MVALHNHRLTDRDLFRGVLWTDEDWHRQRDLFAAALPSDMPAHERQFTLSKMMERYQSAQPTMRERQEIRARLFPFKAPLKAWLDAEEILYLRDRLAGVNDEIGQRIAAKLDRAVARNGK